MVPLYFSELCSTKIARRNEKNAYRLLSQKIIVKEIHDENSNQRRGKFTSSYKVKINVKFTPEQVMKVHLGWGLQRYSFTLSLNSVIDVGVVSMTLSGRFIPRTKHVTHCSRGWMGPGPVWMNAVNLPLPPREFYHSLSVVLFQKRCKFLNISQSNTTVYV